MSMRGGAPTEGERQHAEALKICVIATLEMQALLDTGAATQPPRPGARSQSRELFVRTLRDACGWSAADDAEHRLSPHDLNCEAISLLALDGDSPSCRRVLPHVDVKDSKSGVSVRPLSQPRSCLGGRARHGVTLAP